ncbi:MAG: hydrogenase [Saprospiraceae bacterium]|nr:hydrogenase [Saprospiraceae bacterium]
MNFGNTDKYQADKLLFFGVLLFFLGLAVGLMIPLMANPRMGLSSHLEGVMNGMFLVLLGLIWHKVSLATRWLNLTYFLTLYGSFANFAAVLLAAFTGAGKMMPIAGGKEGLTLVEGLVSFLLVSLALAMLTVCVFVLTGLYRNMKGNTDTQGYYQS